MGKPKKQVKSALRLRKKPTGSGRLAGTATVIKVQRRYQVFEMRREGFSVHDIANTLGVSMATVFEDLRHVLSQTIKETSETAEENRQLDVERLDRLILALTPLTQERRYEVPDPKNPGQTKVVIEPPNLAAISTLTNILARRAKLLALDVPEVKQLNVTGVREYIGIKVEDV